MTRHTNCQIPRNPDGRKIGDIVKKIKCCKWIIADDVDNYHVDFGEASQVFFHE